MWSLPLETGKATDEPIAKPANPFWEAGFVFNHPGIRRRRIRLAFRFPLNSANRRIYLVLFRRNTMKNKLSIALSLAAILAMAIAPFVQAAVWTDQEDYVPGSVVTISGDNSDGAGYVAGETVHVDVWGPNDYVAACDSMVDDNGAWSCQVTLWNSDLAVGDYFYTATGQDSGISQSGTFTDANINTDTTLNSIAGPLTAGQSYSYSGQVSASTAVPDGQTVQLQRRVGGCGSGGWEILATTTTSSGNGSFSGTFTAPSAGTYGFRANFPQTGNIGGNNWRQSESPCQALTVNPPPDTTPPVITPNVVGTLGSNGWYVSDVNVSWTVSDPESPITSTTGCGSSTVNADTSGVTFTCSATSAGGNSSQSVTIKRDATAPTITFVSPSTSPWYNVDVIANWNCTDALSGVVSALASATTSGEGAAVPATGTCTDNAGNAASNTQNFKVDMTAPTITASATKADLSPYTAGTWTNQDVTVHFTCSDGGSGVASCPSDITYNTEGTFSASGIATDNAGNSAGAGFGPIQIDKTAPDISCGSADGLWHGGDVNIGCTASDGGSGLANSADASFLLSTNVPAGTEDANASTGTHTVFDAAGNSAVAGPVSGNKVDKKAPQLTGCDAPDGSWHPGDATLSCDYADGGSGPATQSISLATNVPADTETDNAFASASGAQACDNVGNCAVSPADIGGNKIDKKAPSASAAPDRSPDFGGWYNHALTITFSGIDGGSGLASCDLPVNYSGPDDASAQVSGFCVDNVGNSSGADFDFMYDAAAPTAALSVTAGTPGANGWYTSDVTVHTSGAGAVSGVTCTADQYQTAETSGATFNGSCTSGAGLTTNAAPLTIKLDKTGPTAVLSASGTLGNNGWYVSDVTITTSGADAISAPVVCTAAQSQTTDTTGVTFNGSCTNDAGLTTAADPLTVKRDATAPIISASVSPARPASGWWNIASGAPAVSFTCSDATSGVAGSCPSAHTFGEGENQAHSQMIYDNAGNSASAGVTDIDVDLTAPTLMWSNGPANGGSYDFGFVPAAPTCTAADALSGPNTCNVTGYSNAVGSHTMTAAATDKAGNAYSENRTYGVLGWILKGFYQPVDMFGVYNAVKNGSTVPLKFEIFTQVGGAELTDVAFVKSLSYAQAACSAGATTDDIETLATGGTVLRYDAVGGQFIFNWKTPSGAGKCYRVTMATTDGNSLVAYFRMK
jgi:hypothetical protein